jgi:hypothetical protein
MAFSGETPGRIFWISLAVMAVAERVVLAVTTMVSAGSAAAGSGRRLFGVQGAGAQRAGGGPQCQQMAERADRRHDRFPNRAAALPNELPAMGC